jgi:hypothetical protein
MKSIMPQALINLVSGHVHAVDFPVPVFQDMFGQAASNKSIYAEDQYLEAHEILHSLLSSPNDAIGDLDWPSGHYTGFPMKPSGMTQIKN